MACAAEKQMPLKALLVLVMAVGGTSLAVFNFRKLVLQVLQGKKEMLWDHLGARVGNVQLHL